METLLKAWRNLGNAVPLKIAGDGPLAAAVEEAAAQNSSIQWLKSVSHKDVYDLIGAAAFLVLPSHCYEGLPRVVIEAFAKGTPVIASRLGAIAEIVDDHRNGLRFEAGNPEDLAAKVRRLFSDASRLKRLRRGARECFDRNFTADANHEVLMSIYARAADAFFQRNWREVDTVSVP